MMQRFALEGATVAALDRNPDRLPADIPASAFRADVTDEADVVAVFRQIGETFGRVDALVHTVGAWAGAPFLETSLDAWEQIMRVNLTSTVLCFREAARWMQEHGGRLIGIASGQGADKGRARQGGYSASKAGVIRLVEAVAEEFEGTGITAHAIAPSYILFDDAGDQKGVPVADLTDLAVYLCGPAGAALNGATLRAYGTWR
jgi:NAD(P)-dependent dehydrogenase (short-subunit alcohol dehydrogenase family)